MIDHTHPLPSERQCQFLQFARLTAYYQSRQVSDMTLALMLRIEGLHLQYPVAGTRMLRDLLGHESYAIRMPPGATYELAVTVQTTGATVII